MGSALGYFVVISTVLSLCAVWIPKRAEHFRLPPQRALDLYLYAMIGGFFGARLLHILWEEPAYYFESPLRVFEVWRGGFVWFGGLAFGFVAVWWGLKKDARTVTERMRWLDFFAPITAAAYGVGRLSCVLAGCCYGRACEWTFGNSILAFRYPTQVFAMAWEIAVAAMLLWLQRRSMRGTLRVGRVFWLWLCLHGVGRMIMEFFRDDARGPMAGPFSISMGVSLVFVCLAAWKLSRLHRLV